MLGWSAWKNSTRTTKNNLLKVTPEQPPTKLQRIARYMCVLPIPIASMYGMFTYMYHKNQPNVGNYTIHAWILWVGGVCEQLFIGKKKTSPAWITKLCIFFAGSWLCRRVTPMGKRGHIDSLYRIDNKWFQQCDTKVILLVSQGPVLGHSIISGNKSNHLFHVFDNAFLV